MKVLLVATVQSHIVQFHQPLVKMLHAHGCEVHVAARDNLAEKNGLKLDFVEEVFDIPFQRSPFNTSNIKAYCQLKTIIDNGNYDVIHCNTPVGGIVGRLAARSARKTGTQVYYTAHGFHFYKGGPKKSWLIYYPIEMFMCRFTDKLITITKEDYSLAKKKFKTNVYRMHGIGARSDKYRPFEKLECEKLRKDLGYQPDDQIILCTGELNQNKNQITAIQAMKRVVENFPKAKLLLAGNGPTYDELKKAVESAGLSDKVDLLGYRTDLENFVNISDIILSCSFREGLPMNIVEGMLCRKPVVASKNRGHNELVRNGVTGYLVDAKDADGFADAIIKIFETRDGLVEMGQQGERIGKRYADVAIMSELEEIYQLKAE